MTSTQLRRDEIKIKVVDSGKVVGHGSVSALPLFVKPGKISKLKCELSNDGEPAGAVVLSACFTADNAVDVSKASATKSPPVGDSAMSGASKKEKDQTRVVCKLSLHIDNFFLF